MREKDSRLGEKENERIQCKNKWKEQEFHVRDKENMCDTFNIDVNEIRKGKIRKRKEKGEIPRVGRL